MICWDLIQWLKRPPQKLMVGNRQELNPYTLLMEHHLCLPLNATSHPQFGTQDQ